MAIKRLTTPKELAKRIKAEHNGFIANSVFMLVISFILVVLLIVGWKELGNYIYKIGIKFLSGGVPLAGVRTVWILAVLYGLYKASKSYKQYKEFAPGVKEIIDELGKSDVLSDELEKRATLLYESIRETALNSMSNWF